MTEVTNLSKLMKDPPKSPFYPIIEYCSANTLAYINNKQMHDAKTELKKESNHMKKELGQLLKNC